MTAIPSLASLRRTVPMLRDASRGANDVPPGWHVPPEQFAPDSSDSDQDSLYRPSEMEPLYGRSFARGHSSLAEHRAVEPDGCPRSWTEFKRLRMSRKNLDITPTHQP